MAKHYDYRDDLADIQEGISDLMADLEDVRDEAQDIYDETSDAAVKDDVAQMDSVIELLARALDVLDRE